jgi:hypothetical protein
MAIKKQFVKTKPVCKVTFSVKRQMRLQLLEILTIGTQRRTLNKLKNGTFKGVFSIDKDAAYEFKYVIDGAFVNETEADSFKWNEFAGAENSVLEV